MSELKRCAVIPTGLSNEEKLKLWGAEKGTLPSRCMASGCESTAFDPYEPDTKEGKQEAVKCKKCGHVHITGLPGSVTPKKKGGK